MSAVTVPTMNTGVQSDRASQRGLSQAALRVLGVTALAWGVRLPSAHALARRAPSGYVPQRKLRRLRAAVLAPNVAPALAHSW